MRSVNNFCGKTRVVKDINRQVNHAAIGYRLRNPRRIEDATLENGCLWVEPAAHTSPLRERFNREGDVTTMQSLDSTPWPTAQSRVPLELKAGTLVCFDGKLPHYSAANRSAKSRQAYTLHVTDGICEYAGSNWLQSVDLPSGRNYPPIFVT